MLDLFLHYVLAAKWSLCKTNLQRIGAGFFCAALAFGVSGLVELQLEKTYPNLPNEGQGQIIAYRMLPHSHQVFIPSVYLVPGAQDCDLSFTLTPASGDPSDHIIPTGGFTTDPFQLNLPVGNYTYCKHDFKLYPVLL